MSDAKMRATAMLLAWLAIAVTVSAPAWLPVHGDDVDTSHPSAAAPIVTVHR